MPDEAYSPEMEAWVAKQLRNTKQRDLDRLLTYYQQRGGPGLALVEAEQRRRLTQPTTSR